MDDVLGELDVDMLIWRKIDWKSSSHDLGSVVCSAVDDVLPELPDDDDLDEDDVPDRLDEKLDEDNELELERMGVMINSLN